MQRFSSWKYKNFVFIERINEFWKFEQVKIDCNRYNFHCPLKE